MKRFAAGVSLLAAGALFLTGCASGGFSDSGGGGDVGEDTPVNVVMVGGLTGPAQAIGESTAASLEGVIEEINADGGIAGRQVELTVIDSESDPTKGVSKFQELLSSGVSIDLVYPLTSPDGQALLPLLTREKIMSMSGAANPSLNDPANYPYHFSPMPGQNDVSVAVRDRMLAQGITSFVALVPTDALGQGTAGAIELAFADTGIEYEIVEFNSQDIDLTVPYQTAIAAGKDAIYLDGAGAAAGRLVTARANLGATDIPTFATNSLTTVPMAAMVDPALADGIQAAALNTWTFVPEADRSEELKRLLERDAPGTEETLNNPLIVHDTVYLYKAAVEQAESFAVEDVVQAMYSPAEVPDNFFLLMPEYSFTPESHRPIAPPELWVFVTPDYIEDGMWTSILP